MQKAGLSRNRDHGYRSQNTLHAYCNLPLIIHRASLQEAIIDFIFE